MQESAHNIKMCFVTEKGCEILTLYRIGANTYSLSSTSTECTMIYWWKVAYEPLGPSWRGPVWLLFERECHQTWSNLPVIIGSPWVIYCPQGELRTAWLKSRHCRRYIIRGICDYTPCWQLSPSPNCPSALSGHFLPSVSSKCTHENKYPLYPERPWLCRIN